jgi:hypothetical protein
MGDGMDLVGKQVRVVVDTEAPGGPEAVTLLGTLHSITVVEPPLPEEPPLGSVVEASTSLTEPRRYYHERAARWWTKGEGYVSWAELVAGARRRIETLHLVRREEISLTAARPIPALPRVFGRGDSLPEDVRVVMDVDGDRWSRVGNGERFNATGAPGGRSYPWEYILRRWGPVTQVLP